MAVAVKALAQWTLWRFSNISGHGSNTQTSSWEVALYYWNIVALARSKFQTLTNTELSPRKLHVSVVFRIFWILDGVNFELFGFGRGIADEEQIFIELDRMWIVESKKWMFVQCPAGPCLFANDQKSYGIYYSVNVISSQQLSRHGSYKNLVLQTSGYLYSGMFARINESFL